MGAFFSKQKKSSESQSTSVSYTRTGMEAPLASRIQPPFLFLLHGSYKITPVSQGHKAAAQALAIMYNFQAVGRKKAQRAKCQLNQLLLRRLS